MKTIKVVIIRYKPILVKDIWIPPNMSPLMLKRFLIVNWSKGLWFQSIALLDKSLFVKKIQYMVIVEAFFLMMYKPLDIRKNDFTI